ncbi:hypothetical protein CICLE_v10031844mg [Citrus x clementina]|nr:hypothetical protein CICLE_v10031844mg [Citrus x clementina]ESR50771.1 hypothetical protein CICLE_v10031844mg [Citrus x clementina]
MMDKLVEPKAQMVLVANTSSSNTSDVCPSINQVIHTHDSTIGDASDVFVTPKLLGNSHESESGVQCIHAGGSAAHLKAIQQAVILSRCLLIEKSSRQDEMQRWDMAPYIETIDSQQSSCFILKFFCDLLRIRWESTRSRTKGRALEMMDKLVEGISNSSPGVTQSIPFCYVICIPTIPALRKEYAKLLVSRGLIGEAIKNFEDLVLWDSLILQLKAAAVELIKARLSEKPNDPTLWNDKLTTQPLSLSLSLSLSVCLCQGSDLWKERDRFERFSYASLELCKVYMEISSSSGSRQELFAAEMHLKNVLKQNYRLTFLSIKSAQNLALALSEAQDGRSDGEGQVSSI